MPLSPGAHLGPYEVVAPLGAGGMGEVYRARDPRLGREIAIKMLPAAVGADPERLQRFEREARTVAGLNHPNIVVLHSIEEAGGTRFVTMELVEGQSLDHQVVPGGLPPARVLELGAAIADALAAAHAKGVVHRDLKPANVMLTSEGRVKVLDFGLAKAIAAAAETSRSTAPTITSPPSDGEHVTGTAPYMSPEQLRGEGVDARSDLFSLGVLLFELATGRRPFAGKSFADIAASILRDPTPALTELRADFPQDAAHVIARCLEKDPDRRIQTARDVKSELEHAARTRAAGATTAPTAPPGLPAARGGPSIAVLPFENRSQAAEDESFADGMTEDVISHLAKVKTLKVISRTSVMPFKRHVESLAEIAKKLEVAHLLEGSVRRAGERVRIVAQLVDPASGRTLWAETYDRKLDDIFEIQTDVALQIAGALSAELTPNERQRIRREPTHDLLAYEQYLYGRQALYRFNVDDYRRAIEHFNRALERDPELVLAHVGIALSYTELTEHGIASREEAGGPALAAATKAVELDPELSDAHLALADARLVFELDFAGAEAGFRRAIELSPSNALAFDTYGRMCAGLERYDEAVQLMARAYELDPLVVRADLANTHLRAGRIDDAARVAGRNVSLAPSDSRLRATYGWAIFLQGRQDEGIHQIEEAVRLNPSENMWLAQLGQAYGMAGRTEDAHGVLKRLQDPERANPVTSYLLAYIYTGLGDQERALDLLEHAYEHGDGPVHAIQGSFLFAPLRGHPRFKSLLHRMGIVRLSPS